MSSFIEKEILFLMTNQLFLITHNLDILDLPLCKHSFNFLKKVDQGISIVNTDSLRNAMVMICFQLHLE